MKTAKILAAAALVLAACAVDAKTLRWSSQGDILTMDPHSQNEGLNNSFSDQIYEPLVTRGKDLKVEPCLALSWEQVSPTVTPVSMAVGGLPAEATDGISRRSSSRPARRSSMRSRM